MLAIHDEPRSATSQPREASCAAARARRPVVRRRMGGGGRSRRTPRRRRPSSPPCARASRRSPNRLGDELKQRDALSARLREAELVITAKRRRLETLRAEQVARGAAPNGAARRAGGRDQNALQAERAALAAASAGGVHDRPAGAAQAAVEPEQSGQPRPHARLLRIFRAGAQRQDRHHSRTRYCGCSSWSRKSINKARNCKTLESEASREMAALEHARAERADALGGALQAGGERQSGAGQSEARGAGGGVAGG